MGGEAKCYIFIDGRFLIIVPVPEAESVQPGGLSTGCCRASSKPEPQKGQPGQEKEAGQRVRVERGGVFCTGHSEPHCDSQSQGKLCHTCKENENLTCK